MKYKTIVISTLAALITGSICANAQNSDSLWRATKFHKTPYQVNEGYWPAEEEPAPAPAPAPSAPARAVIPMAGTNTAFIDTSVIRVDKTAPQSVAVGDEFDWNYRVLSKGTNSGIVVTDYIPEGFEYVSSNPPAQVDGNKLTWMIPSLGPGQTKDLNVKLRAVSEGNLSSCFTAEAIPQACLSTYVGRPEIGLTKTGPAKAMIGGNVDYTITVSNTGSYPLRNVVIKDQVPSGLSHASGQSELSFNVGDLAAGQSKNIPVSFKAVSRGEVCNTAVATSSNGGNANAEACTLIVEAGLTIAKTGDEKRKVGKKADYSIVVTNTGDVPLENVRVTDTAPEGTRIVAAPGANVTGNVATWTIPNLAAGDNKTFGLTLTSNKGGTHCNVASVQGPYGLSGRSEACTLWTGVPAILLELIDTQDALLVGDDTTYIVRVTNQGTAQDTNVVIKLEFPAGIDPVSAQGATQGNISGKNVSFAPYTVFRPREVIEFRIPAKASGEGDNRVKVYLDSDLLATPVIEDESTTVY